MTEHNLLNNILYVISKLNIKIWFLFLRKQDPSSLLTRLQMMHSVTSCTDFTEGLKRSYFLMVSAIV